MFGVKWSCHRKGLEHVPKENWYLFILEGKPTGFDHQIILMVPDIVVIIRSDSSRIGQSIEKVVGLRRIEIPTDENKDDTIGEGVFFYRQE